MFRGAYALEINEIGAIHGQDQIEGGKIGRGDLACAHTGKIVTTPRRCYLHTTVGRLADVVAMSACGIECERIDQGSTLRQSLRYDQSSWRTTNIAHADKQDLKVARAMQRRCLLAHGSCMLTHHGVDDTYRDQPVRPACRPCSQPRRRQMAKPSSQKRRISPCHGRVPSREPRRSSADVGAATPIAPKRSAMVTQTSSLAPYRHRTR